jgi:transcriptional regulator with XRE-family HTH domain
LVSMTRDRQSVKRRTPLNQDPKRLRRRRVTARLTITELAAKAGCSVSYLWQLENGDYSASPRLLGVLADALGCEITDLMPPETAEPAPATNGAAALWPAATGRASRTG